MSYRIINGKVCVVEPYDAYNSSEKTKDTKSNPNNFKDILSEKVNPKESFILSKHAKDRLQSRNISLNEQDMKNINEGINKASEKGCNNSVILYKDTALVASIKNRTVITVMDKSSSKDNIFTNIDSVVLL